jgi:UDP-glucose 4-epimerase
MKVLITGGTGYIGSHTAVDLLNENYKIAIADNEYNSFGVDVVNRIKSISGKEFNYYNIDLIQKDLVFDMFKAEKFDGVIHFAALKAVGESMEKPFEYFSNNNVSLLNVMEAAHKFNTKAFIFSSSCTVYGDVKSSPVNENTPINEASSVYGRTKQMGEQIITDCSHHVNFQSCLLRYFNPAGAHISGILGENSKNPALNLIPVITETASKKREYFNVFGDDYATRDGSCIRDYIHVMDLSHAHTLALDYILNGKQPNKVSKFNLGIGQGVSVFEAIRAFEKVCNIKLNYKVLPRRQGDVEAIFCDYSLAKKELGWMPKYDIEDIMRTAWQFESNKN